MKYFTAFLVIIAASTAYSQNMGDYISKAKAAYSGENYEEARMNLQNALAEIDKLIAKEILASLPKTLGSLDFNVEKDQSSGTGSTMLGLYVSRYFGTEEGKHVELTVADNSPMMSMVSTFLNNPMLSGMAGMASGQKVIRVDGYKGMLQQDEEDGSINIMIPFGDSLVSFTSNVSDESEMMNMVNQVSISRIASIVD